MEDSVKLTDTQRRLLAAASKRDDRALERPSHLTGGAAGKVVAKLLAEGDLVPQNCSDNRIERPEAMADEMGQGPAATPLPATPSISVASSDGLTSGSFRLTGCFATIESWFGFCCFPAPAL
jgi:hypothetical protein